MTLSPLQGHLYYYGGQLFISGATLNPKGSAVTDAKIDWYTDGGAGTQANSKIYAALVGPYSPLGGTAPTLFSQLTAGNTGGSAPYQVYYSDISNYDISSQTGFTGTGYSAGGVQLLSIVPYLDAVTYSPLAYVEVFASNSSLQAPARGSATNGFYATSMTYTGMQGVVIYKKTTGANTTWPLLGYLDMCGGSINTVSTGTISNGQTAAINVTPNTGLNFTTYANGVGTGGIGGQVYVGDVTHWEANTITSVTASTITLTNATSHAYATGTKILQANNASVDEVKIILGTAYGMFQWQIN